MKNRIFGLAAIVLLALSAFAVVPAISYEPPPPEPQPTVLYIDPQELKFTGPCIESREFEAEVIIYNVVDLYAWDFAVYWNPNYLEMLNYTIKVPPDWGPEDYTILIEKLETDATWERLHIAVTRLGDVPGFNGTTPLLNLWFHVIYEPCWPECVETWIKFSTEYPPKFSNACGGEITLDEVHESKIELNSSQPNIEVLFSDVFDLTANKKQGWKKDQVITAYVWISNVTKFYEVKVRIKWNTTLLHLDYQQITINEEAFPQPWVKLSMEITSDTWDYLTVIIGRPDEPEKYLKGTFWLLKLDFKVKCVRDGYGVPINASTVIRPVDGYMMMCGVKYKPCDPVYNFTLSWSEYYWTPIPYDFDQNGHVAVEDIMIILEHYGEKDTSWDLNGDGVVDIYDVVIVAKHYCDNTPPPIDP